MRKVLILDVIHPLVKSGLESEGYEVHEDYASSKEELAGVMPEYSGIILRSRFNIDDEFIDAAKNLTFIGRYGAGLENIDVEYAGSKNIKCIRVPEGNRDAVGEHALGMLLMLLNHLKKADSEVRKGTWDREGNRGYEINGKVVGIIGYGYMGSGFAEKLQGMGCRILAYDKYKSDYAPDYVSEVQPQDLFEECDILSLHVPLTSETEYMVNEEFLGRFKKPIYLINTARGPVVNSKALLNGLREGKVKGACLDVLEYEKSSFENLFEDQHLPDTFKELLEREDVIFTPHIAGWSFESYEKLGEVMLKKIISLHS